jgi:hypothetical protein
VVTVALVGRCVSWNSGSFLVATFGLFGAGMSCGPGDPVVALLDDGRLLVLLDVATARDLGDAVPVAELYLRVQGDAWPGRWTQRLARRLSGDRPLDTPIAGPISAVAVEELLATGTLAGMRISDACTDLGLGRTRVYELRESGVLRPAGPGRVLAVDVERERATREGRS